jgi:hypothetical protein
MARVWFARRRGGQWIAPGGMPAFELPFADLIFPLDIGTHRRVEGDPPVPAPELPAEPPTSLHKVLIEVEPKDITALEFSGYSPGLYDSPFSPAEATRRLSALRSPRQAPASARL